MQTLKRVMVLLSTSSKVCLVLMGYKSSWKVQKRKERHFFNLDNLITLAKHVFNVEC